MREMREEGRGWLAERSINPSSAEAAGAAPVRCGGSVCDCSCCCGGATGKCANAPGTPVGQVAGLSSMACEGRENRR